MRVRSIVLLAATTLLGGCAATGETPVEAVNEEGREMLAPDQPAASPSYRLYPGDELQVSVMRRPELSLRVRVDPYGHISYPYLGEVDVRDLTAIEVAQRLAKGLQEGQYYTNPVITVSVVSYKEQFVYVLGEVKRPGAVAAAGPIPLLSAISAAGGQTYDAEMSTLLWIRGRQSPPGVVKLDLQAFGDPRNRDARIPNLMMLPGDVLFVPDSVIASVERFMNRMFNIIRPVVELERGLVLYPEVERFLQGEADDPRNQIIVLSK